MLAYLSQHYHLGIVSILPMMVMFGLNMLRKPAELVMFIGIFLAFMVAVVVQHVSVQFSVDALYNGSIVLDAHPLLAPILNRGGIVHMLSSLSLTLLILALGGLFESYHFMTILFSTLLKKLETPFSLVSATLCLSVISNMLVSEAYLSIMMMSKIFGDVYKENKLDSCLLSKAIEESTTFSTLLIP